MIEKKREGERKRVRACTDFLNSASGITSYIANHFTHTAIYLELKVQLHSRTLRKRRSKLGYYENECVKRTLSYVTRA